MGVLVLGFKKEMGALVLVPLFLCSWFIIIETNGCPCFVMFRLHVSERPFGFRAEYLKCRAQFG